MKRRNLRDEAVARDKALDLLEATRPRLIDVARQVAEMIASVMGRVTGPEVRQTMAQMGYEKELDEVDGRFIGAVFRAGKGWERIGHENSGSHRQPISVWRLSKKSG